MLEGVSNKNVLAEMSDPHSGALGRRGTRRTVHVNSLKGFWVLALTFKSPAGVSEHDEYNQTLWGSSTIRGH